MKAILIKADGGGAEVDIDESLDALREAIGGGWVQMLNYPARPDAVVWFDEEGKIKGLPMNETATKLMDEMLFAEDYIAGDMLVTGIDPNSGETLEIPADLEGLVGPV